jgi:SAM-dependent methyltransferase
MHKSSYQHMARAIETHLAGKAGTPLTILDIGAYDVNASYRPLFNKPGWKYQGVDIAAGPNVDMVLNSVYEFPIESDSVDVIVSGQTFEHIEFFWLTWQEMVRILKPGGHIILIAPSRGQEHRYPVDCWRFYPDGFRALGKLGKLEVLEVHTDWLPVKPGFWFRLLNFAKRSQWGDTVGVFRKS